MNPYIDPPSIPPGVTTAQYRVHRRELFQAALQHVNHLAATGCMEEAEADAVRTEMIGSAIRNGTLSHHWWQRHNWRAA